MSLERSTTSPEPSSAELELAPGQLDEQILEVRRPFENEGGGVAPKGAPPPRSLQEGFRRRTRGQSRSVVRPLLLASKVRAMRAEW